MNTVTVLIEGYAKEEPDGWVASSTTTLIRTPRHAIIVDPGINKQKLLESMDFEGLKVSDIDYVFLTHYHPDHILLTALFDQAKVFDGETVYETDTEVIYEGTIPDTDIIVIPTPGHAHEHASLVVHTEDQGIVVIAADVFWWMSHEEQKVDDYKALINKQDPFTKDWMALQESRRKVLEVADRIIPGHGKMFKNPHKK